MSVIFKIDGPFDVPRSRNWGGYVISDSDVEAFWENCPGLKAERGCYVFALRNGRGTLPGYVGKATRSFGQEIFQAHKKNRYQEFLSYYRKGTPVLFFVVAPKTRGKPNQRAIGECERELIALASRTNPDLTNRHGKKEPTFAIRHVTEFPRGRVGVAARAFNAMLGLTLPSANQPAIGEAALEEANVEPVGEMPVQAALDLAVNVPRP